MLEGIINAITGNENEIVAVSPVEWFGMSQAERAALPVAKKIAPPAVDMPNGFHQFTPEMGEVAPANADIFARLGHYGEHWFIKSRNPLKGRGIVFRETLTAATLVPGSRFVGWHEYRVTDAALEKLKASHVVACERLLD